MNSSTDDITITYPVERSLIERAVELLSRQQRTINRFHKFLVRASIAFATIYVLVFFLLGVAAVFQDELDGTSLTLIPAALVIFLFVAGVLLAIAFLAGFVQMGVQWLFFRQLRKIGFGETTLEQPPTWMRRFLQVFGPIAAVIGVLFLYTAAVVFAVSVDPETTLDWRTLRNVAGMSLLFGSLLTVPYFISHRRQSLGLIRRLDDLARRLSQALSEAPADETVEIRVQDLNLMARMEQTHIEIERSKDVTKARREERPDDLVLRNTKNALEAMRKLEPETRMLVREQAASLTETAEPTGAKWDADTGQWQLVVPDTQVQLNYVLDKERHQINLVSVVNREALG